MSPNVCNEELSATRIYLTTNTMCAWPWQNTKFFGRKHVRILGPETGKILEWRRNNISSTNTTVDELSCVEKNQVDFRKLGNLLRPSKSISVSRERVIPTEWQVPTILGDCIPKVKVHTVHALQYREHTFISGFLDFANFEFTNKKQ